MIFTIIILAVTPINSYLSISMIDYHIHHAQKFGGNSQTVHPAMICAVFTAGTSILLISFDYIRWPVNQL